MQDCLSQAHVVLGMKVRKSLLESDISFNQFRADIFHGTAEPDSDRFSQETLDKLRAEMTIEHKINYLKYITEDELALVELKSEISPLEDQYRTARKSPHKYLSGKLISHCCLEKETLYSYTFSQYVSPVKYRFIQ